jgi:hypothetical protein
VGERPEPQELTAQVVMKDGKLPDPASFQKAVRQVSEQFSVRGVELVVDGVYETVDGKPALRIPESRELLILAPLTRKVQWDKKRDREAAATDEEKSAFERLTVAGVTAGARLLITGPLTVEAGKPPALQVRIFTTGEPGTK